MNNEDFLLEFRRNASKRKVTSNPAMIKEILSPVVRLPEEDQAKYLDAFRTIAMADVHTNDVETLQSKGRKYMFFATVFIFISSITILGLAAYDIISKRRDDKRAGSTYKALLQKREADRLYAMHWQDGPATRIMEETQQLLQSDPTYWTFGPHGFAVWVNYRFPVDLKNPSPEENALRVGEPKTMILGPLACLSEIVVRDEELAHHFVSNSATGDVLSHSDVVSVSADVNVPDDRKGFVHSAIALLEDNGSTFYFDKVHSRFTARCKNVPLACVLLSFGLKAVFKTAANADLKALQISLQKDWLAVSNLDNSEVQKFLSYSSFAQTGTPSTLTSTSLSIEYILKYDATIYPELSPSLYAFKNALETIQNLTMNFVPTTVFVDGKFPTQQEMIWTEEMRTKSLSYTETP